MTAWWALLRRARRLAVRSPMRTLWTGFLVVAAVAAGTVLLSDAWGHHVLTGSEDLSFGGADAVYAGSAFPADRAPEAVDAVRAALPAGSSAEAQVTTSGLVLGGPGSRGLGDAHMADWESPVMAGALHLVEGRAPRAGEAVLTPRLAAQTSLRAGDQLEVLGSDRTLRVVGIGTVGNSDDLGIAVAPNQLVVPPSSMPTSSADLRIYVGLPAGASAPEATDIPVPGGAESGVKLQGPSSRDVGRRVSTDGFSAGSDTTNPAGAMGGIVAAVALVVGLLAGAAFGIGAGRRMRAGGILSANGANDAQLGLAVATEALVVAAPAAVLGVVAAWAARPVWIRFRLPSWVTMAESEVPWPWVGIAVVAALVAAVAGAVLFSKSLRTMPTTALLDGRRSGRAAGRGPQRIGWIGWLGLGLFGYAAANLLLGFATTRRSSVGSMATVIAVALWAGCALGSLRLARLVLRRDVIGRLVDRDLRRQALGSTAVIVVVATWVFVAVAGTATGWSDVLSAPDGTVSTSGVVQPLQATTTIVADGTSPSGEPAGSPTSAPTANGETSGISANSGISGTSARNDGGDGVLIRISTSASGDPSGSTNWVVRGSEPANAENAVPLADELPEDLSAGLAAAGLMTSPAIVGSWTGGCPVCPSGYVPTVAVLDSADGAGLPSATAELLRSGAAVTAFAVPGVEAATVAGVPVRVGELPIAVDAVVLGSSITDGSQLSAPQPALVGATGDLSDQQADQVGRIVRDAGLELTASDRRLDRAWSDATSTGFPIGSTPDGWAVWPWLIVLVVVTLAATAAHRQEHGEAGRVLHVLGAGPRAGRRLASLTAGTLAGIGVGMGLAAAMVLVAISAARTGGEELFLGLWNREATLLVVASLAVPLAAALMARLIPPARSADGPGESMPA